jgi:hypothetical protein
MAVLVLVLVLERLVLVLVLVLGRSVLVLVLVLEKVRTRPSLRKPPKLNFFSLEILLLTFQAYNPKSTKIFQLLSFNKFNR